MRNPRTRRALALAVSSLFVAAPAWAGRGGSNGNSNSVAPRQDSRPAAPPAPAAFPPPAAPSPSNPYPNRNTFYNSGYHAPGQAPAAPAAPAGSPRSNGTGSMPWGGRVDLFAPRGFNGGAATGPTGSNNSTDSGNSIGSDGAATDDGSANGTPDGTSGGSSRAGGHGGGTGSGRPRDDGNSGDEHRRDLGRQWRSGRDYRGYQPVYLLNGLGYSGAGYDPGDPPPLPPDPPVPPAGPPVPPGGPLLADPPAPPFPPPVVPANPANPAIPADPTDPAAAAQRQAQVQAQLQAQMEREEAARLNQTNADLAKAMADADAAAARVRQSLINDPEYRSAVADKKAATAQAEAMRAGLNDTSAPRTDVAEVLPVARRGLEAARKIRQMESDAMANDPRLAEAKARVQALLAVRKSLQDHLQATPPAPAPAPANPAAP